MGITSWQIKNNIWRFGGSTIDFFQQRGPSPQQEEVKTIAANRDTWRDSVKALQGMYHKARKG